jgi:transcription initiation factor TFIID TATA-box-binding protein
MKCILARKKSMNNTQRQREGNGNQLDVKPTWKVENVVATVSVIIDDVGGRINLNDIARKYTDCEYNPERFPGLVMRMEEPRATLLLFSTGKMVITGLRKEDDVEPAMEKIIDKLSKAHVKCKDPVFTVQNIVASGNMHAPVYLDDAAMLLENAVYEPEVFPGLIYRMEVPKCCFLIFSTGKFVCTGAKESAVIEKASMKLADAIRSLKLARSGPEEDGIGNLT